MRIVLLVALLLHGIESKAIRQKRAVSSYSNLPASITVISDSSNTKNADEIDVATYQSMLETILRQINQLDDSAPIDPDNMSPAELSEQYQRAYYTQAAAEIVQKLVNYGALSAIVDAEAAAYYEYEEEETTDETALEKEVLVYPEYPVPDADELTDDQAREIIRLIVDDLMNRFYSDINSTGMEEEQKGKRRSEKDDSSSSSSSSSEEDDEIGSEEEVGVEGEDQEEEEEDDAVVIVNKQVTTSIIRIPSTIFVDTMSKLMGVHTTRPYLHGTQLTPLQIEDPTAYSEIEKPLSGSTSDQETTPRSDPELVYIAPILPVVYPMGPIMGGGERLNTGEASYGYEQHHGHRGFDLGSILLVFAAILIVIWVLLQLYSMHRKRSEAPTLPMAAPAPAKVVPSIIPNIYATPPASRRVDTQPSGSLEKPPIYMENPSFEKPAA